MVTHVEYSFTVDGEQYEIRLVLKTEVRNKRTKKVMASSSRLDGYLKDEVERSLKMISHWFDPKDSETLEEL